MVTLTAAREGGARVLHWCVEGSGKSWAGRAAQEMPRLLPCTRPPRLRPLLSPRSSCPGQEGDLSSFCWNLPKRILLVLAVLYWFFFNYKSLRQYNTYPWAWAHLRFEVLHRDYLGRENRVGKEEGMQMYFLNLLWNHSIIIVRVSVTVPRLRNFLGPFSSI